MQFDKCVLHAFAVPYDYDLYSRFLTGQHISSYLFLSSQSFIYTLYLNEALVETTNAASSRHSLFTPITCPYPLTNTSFYS